MRNPSPMPSCDFCGDPVGDVGLLFRSARGGSPPFICDGCVEGFAELTRIHKTSPELAETLIVAHNRRINGVSR